MNNKKIRIICISMLSLILFVYLTICINSYVNESKIGFFNLRFYVMSSDLEGEKVNKGDLVLAKNISTKNIEAGDLIIYKNDDEMLVKKVKNVNKSGESVNLVVEDNGGDVLKQQDSSHQIIGKVVCNLAGLGNVALFLQSPMGMIDIIFIIGSIIIVISKIGKINKHEVQEEKNELIEQNLTK